MNETLSITGGRLIDPANGVDARLDLHIADGQVVAIGEAPQGFQAQQTIDASGQVVCPGLIDLAARLREPGQEYKATIASETEAAAKGGVTTLCCCPDTDPVLDTPADAALVVRRAKRAAKSRVLPVGALTKQLQGQELSEMTALTHAGCVALSNGYHPLASTLVERRAMEYAATFGLTLILRPEDAALRDGGCAHEGPVSSRLGLPGVPEAAETVAVARDLALAGHSGCRVHFRSLSAAASVRLLQQARNNRLPVSADVAIHQLHLTEMDIEGFEAMCHVRPPLRSLRDRDGLRDGVAQGTISAICSDHQPHDADAKLAPFPSTAHGISGIETLLSLTLKLVDEGVLPLGEALARLTAGPAGILGLPLGQLGVGASADVCIFDPERYWRVEAQQLLSAGKNTPFDGWELPGVVTRTLLEGRTIYREQAQ